MIKLTSAVNPAKWEMLARLDDLTKTATSLLRKAQEWHSEGEALRAGASAIVQYPHKSYLTTEILSKYAIRLKDRAAKNNKLAESISCDQERLLTEINDCIAWLRAEQSGESQPQ